MAIEAPRCWHRSCKHLIGVYQPQNGSEQGERPCCDAFPKGIPDAIAYGDNLHLEPFPGDHGIQYEKG